MDSLRNNCEELEEKHVIQTQKLREEMRALHNKHRQEAASLDASHKVSVVLKVLFSMHYISITKALITTRSMLGRILIVSVSM